MTLDPTAVGGSLVQAGTGTLTLVGQSGYIGSTTI
jgi:autotransporter-associated beta strand protein